MLPALVNAPSSRPDRQPAPDRLLASYLAALAARGAGNSSFLSGARAFLRRWPDLHAWAAQPLPGRLAVNASTRPLLNHLMLFGQLQPGYDYLLERKLPAVLREAQASPLADDMNRFLAAATELGYTSKVTAGLASQIAVRMLIQTRRPLLELTDADIAEFDTAISAREQQGGQPLKHYHTALYATRTVLYHLGAPVTTVATKKSAHLRWPWERHFTDVPDPIARSLVAYLECASGTRTRSTVLAMAGRLAHFARQLAAIDPELASLGGLDRQRHIEPYLAAVAAARHPHTGGPLSASERRSRILTVGGWSTTSTSGVGRRRPAGGWSSPATFPGSLGRCPATCLPTPTGGWPPRCATRRGRCAPAPCCWPAPPACGSVSWSTSSSTACTRFPAPAPG